MSLGSQVVMSSERHGHSVIFFVLPVCLLVLFTMIVGNVLIIWGLKTYRIPANSMDPTLWAGDICFVEKFTYCFSQPKRGDVVMFSTDGLSVPSTDLPWCERIIGVPGDVLEVKSGRIHVNGCPLSECKPKVGPTDLIGPSVPYLQYMTHDGDKLIVPEGTYFLIGDHITDSIDSRLFGPVARGNILSRVAAIMHSGHWRLSVSLGWPLPYGPTAL